MTLGSFTDFFFLPRVLSPASCRLRLGGGDLNKCKTSPVSSFILVVSS